MEKKKYSQDALYFSDRLKEKLNAVLAFPLTLVEAPLGYGKTTALRWTLEKAGAKVLWHTVFSGGNTYFWPDFCEAWEPLSPEISEGLRQIGLPSNEDAILKAAKIINDYSITQPTVFVLDDYHFVDSADIDKFISYLLMNIPEPLHIVIVSCNHFRGKEILKMKLQGVVNYIDKQTMTLDLCDVKNYFSLCGINLTDEQQARLFAYSEGWIAPLYLSVMEYAATGQVTASENVKLLVRDIIYAPLSDEIKKFLNCISVFDSFTLKQAKFVWHGNNAEQLLAELMLSNSLITLDPASGRYSFHNLLMNHIRDAFECLPQEEKKQIWQQAGCYYLEKPERYSLTCAMEYFNKAENFTFLLKALTSENRQTLTNEQKSRLIYYFDHCPEEILSKHLDALLIFMRFMISFHEIERLRKGCVLFEKYIGQFPGTNEEKNTLLMHYEHLVSLTKYNNIPEMSKHHQKALSYASGQILNLEQIGNWTFGNPSILLMFYRESGKLHRHLKELKECLPIYYLLTDGHGSGAEYVMEAEIAFHTGNFKEAEALIQQGQYYAREKKQWSILLAAGFLQMRLAMMRGNYFEITNIYQQLADLMESKQQYLLKHALDLCESYFYLLLNIYDRVADWIADGDFSKTRLLFPALPSLHIVHGRYLLEKEKYTMLIGIGEVALRTSSVYPNIMGMIYANIYLAIAQYKSFGEEQAMVHLIAAMDLALPDNVFMPFVENIDYLTSLFKPLTANEKYKAAIERICLLGRTFTAAQRKIMHTHFFERANLLNEREEEVARLAAKGLSNREIAGKLYISEGAVKSRMTNVFEKLSITSRKQLQGLFSK